MTWKKILVLIHLISAISDIFEHEKLAFCLDIKVLSQDKENVRKRTDREN